MTTSKDQISEERLYLPGRLGHTDWCRALNELAARCDCGAAVGKELLPARDEAKPSMKYLKLGHEYVRDHLKTIEGGTAVCLFAIWLDARSQAAQATKAEPSEDRVPDHELLEYIEELEPGHTLHRLLTELVLLRALTDMPVDATSCAMCADGVGREYGYHEVDGKQIECPALKSDSLP